MSAPSDNDAYHNSRDMAGKGRLPTWDINTFVTGLQEAASTGIEETQNRSALKQTSASENTDARLLDSPTQSGVQAGSKLDDAVSSDEAKAVSPTSNKSIELERVGAGPVLQTTQSPSKAHHVPLPPLRRPLDVIPPPLPPFVLPSMQQVQASAPPVALTLTGQPRKAANPNVGTRMAHNPAYYGADVVPPPGTTLYDVCQIYPQSIHGEVLKDFIRLDWKATRILRSLPAAYVAQITLRVSSSNNNANVFHKRLRAMTNTLTRTGEYNTLMSSPPRRRDGRPGHTSPVPILASVQNSSGSQAQASTPQAASTASVSAVGASAASTDFPLSGTSSAWSAVNDLRRGPQANADSSADRDKSTASETPMLVASAVPHPSTPEKPPAHIGPVPSLPRLVTTPNGTAPPYIPTDVMKRIEATVTRKALPTARADEWSDSSDEDQDE